MDQWIEFAKVYGPLGAIALALGAFLYFKVWPIFIARLEKADKQQEEFAKRLEDQGKLFTASLQFEREENAIRFDEQGRLFTEALRTQNVMAGETQREIAREIRAFNHTGPATKRQPRKRGKG